MRRKDIKSWLRRRNVEFWRGDEAKFIDFMITNKCGIDFGDLDCNKLGAKINMDFFLSLIFMFELLLCQKRQEEIKRSITFFLKTNTREMMRVSRILSVVVVATSSLTTWVS
jgi:hypothetical protein